MVSVGHVLYCAHPGGHQHGISIQISISLGETFLRIISYMEFSPDLNLGWGTWYIYLISFPRFQTLSIKWFWFWSILNVVILKTSDKLSLRSMMINVQQLTMNIWTCWDIKQMKNSLIKRCYWQNIILVIHQLKINSRYTWWI